jgi:Electron transfer DM13
MKRRLVRPLLAVLFTIGIGVAALFFQPWKLWIDDRVDEATPEGARQVTVATTAPPVGTTSIPDAAPTTAPNSTSVPRLTGTEFVSIDHGTSGRLLLLEDENGTRFFRFEDFETDNGPDLFVYLSTNPADGEEGEFDDDFVNLGRLDGNVGDQNYEIPADADLSRYSSIVIWCDRFNSAFGAAPLL